MKTKYLYHGSPYAGLNELIPRMHTKRSGQKKPRVYAVTKKEEASIFACPFNEESQIKWKKGKIHFLISKKYYQQYPASIYVLSSEGFEDVDGTGIEFFSENSVEVIKEIKIKDALRYAKRKGAVIEFIDNS